VRLATRRVATYPHAFRALTVTLTPLLLVSSARLPTRYRLLLLLLVHGVRPRLLTTCQCRMYSTWFNQSSELGLGPPAGMRPSPVAPRPRPSLQAPNSRSHASATFVRRSYHVLLHRILAGTPPPDQTLAVVVQYNERAVPVPIHRRAA
jgi:hypothetical protein